MIRVDVAYWLGCGRLNRNQRSTMTTLMTTLALIVDWCGAFPSIKKAREAAKDFGLGEVLYLAAGQRKYQHRVTMQ
jgi:hypothetical protein